MAAGPNAHSKTEVPRKEAALFMLGGCFFPSFYFTKSEWVNRTFSENLYLTINESVAGKGDRLRG
jgi:hypothetical protein